MELTPQVPRGHHKMVDQDVRAATGAEALIAEGALFRAFSLQARFFQG